MKRALTVFILSLGIHLAGLGTLPLMDRDEPRFAETSREMLETRDFLIPRFNGLERYDKPPFFYWCQTASYRLFGENDFAARFPSALGAALTALLLFRLGSRFYDEKTGLWASVLFTACAQTLLLAKAGVADMWLAFFYTAAIWSAWEGMVQKKSRWRTVLCLSLALGFLTKGPVAFLPILALLTFAHFTKTELDKRALMVSIAAAVFLAGAWAVPALIKTQGAYFEIGIGRHVVERSLKPLEHHGGESVLGYAATLPFYLVTFFLSFLPWSWRTPWMIRLLKQRPMDPAMTYLLHEIACVFIVFSLIRTKLPHYTFPAFPIIALLWAHLWTREKWPERRLALGAGVMITVSLFVSLAVFPFFSSVSAPKNLAQNAAPYLKAGMPLGSAGYEEPSLVWYFRKYLRSRQRTLAGAEVSAFMREKGARVCVLPTDRLRTLFPFVPAGWKTFSTQGTNIAKGKPAALTALIKPD